jgi:uncharacterized protein YjbI with pentapeptide repeats
MRGANLTGANLAGADLARVNLVGARMSGANLYQSRLYLTRIQGLDLSRAQGLTQAQIDTACGDRQTVLPQGLKLPAGWPCQPDN